jgi:hypothetical protein
MLEYTEKIFSLLLDLAVTVDNGNCIRDLGFGSGMNYDMRTGNIQGISNTDVEYAVLPQGNIQRDDATSKSHNLNLS